MHFNGCFGDSVFQGICFISSNTKRLSTSKWNSSSVKEVQEMAICKSFVRPPLDYGDIIYDQLNSFAFH